MGFMTISGRIDAGAGIVRTGQGGETELGPKTARLLKVLAAARGEVLSKQQLIETVWPDTHVSEDSLYQAVADIRRGLGEDGAKILVTKARRGYALRIPEDSVPARRRVNYWWVLPISVCLFLAGFLATRIDELRAPMSIAVHPFQSEESSDRLSLFGTSMASEIATAIAGNGWLQVYDADSEHRARFAMNGLILEFGGRVHIQAHLSETETGRVVWSKSWDGAVDQLLDLQHAVATEAAEALGGH